MIIETTTQQAIDKSRKLAEELFNERVSITVYAMNIPGAWAGIVITAQDTSGHEVSLKFQPEYLLQIPEHEVRQYLSYLAEELGRKNFLKPTQS